MAVRIISALVAIAIAVVILIFSKTIVLSIAVAFICVVMLHELYNAAKSERIWAVSVPAFVCAGLMPFFSLPELSEYKFAVASVCIFFMFFGYILNHEKLKFETVFFMVAEAIMIPLSMDCIVKMRYMDSEHSMAYIVLALCGAWFADTGAYFTGTFLGKHKLCPKISPKKTVEGLIGGILITGILFMVFCMVYLKITDSKAECRYWLVFILGMACAAAGTVGDLVASLIKRQCGIKDYGKIMPGHGGLMDRFDSVLFVLPFFYSFITVFDIFK